jgi:hypothetical protein
MLQARRLPPLWYGLLQIVLSLLCATLPVFCLLAMWCEYQ